VLSGGPGSANVIIGFQPAWRGLGAAGVAALNQAVTDMAETMVECLSRAATGDASAPKELAEAVVDFAEMMASLGCDIHSCGLTTPNPHVTGVVTDGSPTVMINGMPACRMGDTILEAGPPNKIAMGCPTVIIGDIGMGGAVTTQGQAMKKAKESGVPFCEKCRR
jgi:uncharacterized Zn-binding protein involved in type VI secretion